MACCASCACSSTGIKVLPAYSNYNPSYLMHNHPTSLGKRERQGAPSHCPPDSVPLLPRQGRSPVTCPPDRVPPFPLISGGFALRYTIGLLITHFATHNERKRKYRWEVVPQRNCSPNFSLINGSRRGRNVGPLFEYTPRRRTRGSR